MAHTDEGEIRPTAIRLTPMMVFLKRKKFWKKQRKLKNKMPAASKSNIHGKGMVRSFNTGGVEENQGNKYSLALA